MQELQDSLRKIDKASLHHISPELKQSLGELREVTVSMQVSGKTPVSECGPAEKDSAIRQGEREQPDFANNVESVSARIFPAPANSDNT